MLTIRQSAVAGVFYPENPVSLRECVSQHISAGQQTHAPISSRPKALIVPHAGYEYSGPIAGTAYAQLLPIADSIERVVLLGPSHHVGFSGLATSGANYFETPLGDVPIDTERVEDLQSLPEVTLLDEAHASEHSLEVQLPFLQVALPNSFKLIPLVVGMATTKQIAEVIDFTWGGPETLFVVSSDLSHYKDYATAQKIDLQTTKMIESLQFDELSGERACGFAGIQGLLNIAKHLGLRVTTLDLRNSGDTSIRHDHVVGYGAYVVHD
ncbi:hypothetical protein CA13_10100 [Planctomycetes bacterium CA13]|uniref:MEMO1 family protein CA13_10100 n=1 Tax=Novipirellula herctigrandis TaxID=2527986 RepID=A0A5C5YY08_9BACT|nr:hypothetical protein CA13_10100 [Planctomycetes bacterium CA13]